MCDLYSFCTPKVKTLFENAKNKKPFRGTGTAYTIACHIKYLTGLPVSKYQPPVAELLIIS